MFKQLVLLVLVAATTAAPVKEEVGTAAVAHGIDTAGPITDAQAECLFKNGFVAGFFRIGNKALTDYTGIENVLRAVRAKLAYEVFITPNPAGTAESQISGAVRYARTKNLAFTRVWLQVTAPILWNKDQGANIRFINDFIRAGQRLNLKVGLYTNWYDYEQITANSRAIPNTDIWYWHVNSPGPNGEGSPEHTDYRPFGPFTGAARAKQYAIGSNHCGLVVNKDSFPANLQLQLH